MSTSDNPYQSSATGSQTNPIAPNATRLLWAGFMAILAAGVGFAIRGGILDNWGREFGFTGEETGSIIGASFTGFCFGIVIGGIIVDKIGYGKLVIAAFMLHILSAVITFSAVGGTDRDLAYQLLWWGMLTFAVANGTLEAVANPLIATLFPHNRTHYLNILHASWPAGLVLGSALGWLLDDAFQLDWKIQLAFFLVPTFLYGVIFFGQSFPKSEASAKGLSVGEMLKDVGLIGGLVACALIGYFFAKDIFGSKAMTDVIGSNTPSVIGTGIGAALLVAVLILTNFSFGSLLLFTLFIAHALVGAVELGTDGWIQNITGNILSSSEGKFLFVFTSTIMFLLRFCADFIEKRLGLSPVALLLCCAILACVGLLLTSRVHSFGMALLALSVYAVGKTFFWPTMLAVASDRFPRTGAIAISMMGGIGMMSAGLIGGPGLGYFKDRYAGEALQTTNAGLYAEYKAEKPSKFLPFIFPDATGLDAKKLGEATVALTELRKSNPRASAADLPAEQKTVLEASIAGDRKTLVTDAVIPATMAVIYLGLLLYFASIGGYKVVTLASQERRE